MIGIGAAVLLTLGLWHAGAGEQPRSGAKADSAALLKRGEYLVTDVAHCGHCHTPQDARGQPDAAHQLQGATLPIQPKKKTDQWADKSPDITRSGLAGMWSEAEMVKFLMTGVDPEGNKPRPPMPIFRLHQEDAQAVTAYLRSQPGKKGPSAR
jgi:D-sorbitol dehydrogenase (acceptor)